MHQSAGNVSQHFAECSKTCAVTKTIVMPLVEWQCADLNMELSQHSHKHLQMAERTRKLPQHALIQL